MADLAHNASGPASSEPAGIAMPQAGQPASSDKGKLRVFISYSRDDLKFADQLEAALNLWGFECLIDRHDISGGEDWKRRLGNLIREADTVAFVLSPSSARSPTCDWEVEEAAGLNKRIVPATGGISGKTSGNRGPVAQMSSARVVSVGVQACNGAPEGRRHERLQATEHLWEIGLPADYLIPLICPTQQSGSKTPRALAHLFESGARHLSVRKKCCRYKRPTAPADFREALRARWSDPLTGGLINHFDRRRTFRGLRLPFGAARLPALLFCFLADFTFWRDLPCCGNCFTNTSAR